MARKLLSPELPTLNFFNYLSLLVGCDRVDIKSFFPLHALSESQLLPFFVQLDALEFTPFRAFISRIRFVKLKKLLSLQTSKGIEESRFHLLKAQFLKGREIA